jgi:hypothetical protein
MRSIFSIHAGEYITGDFIEHKLKDNANRKLNVWIPSKDTGVDLLITNQSNSKMVTIQVKFSKDYTGMISEEFQSMQACGWWVLDLNRIRDDSKADYWVLVINHKTLDIKKVRFVIIEPSELYKRLKNIHNNTKKVHSYLWVTSDEYCWETRGLKKQDKHNIQDKIFNNNDRNFTKYLSNWNPIIKKLS